MPATDAQIEAALAAYGLLEVALSHAVATCLHWGELTHLALPAAGATVEEFVQWHKRQVAAN